MDKLIMKGADGAQDIVIYTSNDGKVHLDVRIEDETLWLNQQQICTLYDKLGGGNYWKELLNRIRDIRSSEKVMYRQVLDIYATAVDYDPRSELSLKFFKIVQTQR